MACVKIGVAGPVGCGKTALIEVLTRRMAADYSIGVITNDIYTKEDAQFLAKNSVITPDRITGVETGGCPHTAIREDASMNLEAVDYLKEKFPCLEPEVRNPPTVETHAVVTVVTSKLHIDCLHNQLKWRVSVAIQPLFHRLDLLAELLPRGFGHNPRLACFGFTAVE